jgi:hypothetical protein
VFQAGPFSTTASATLVGVRSMVKKVTDPISLPSSIQILRASLPIQIQRRRRCRLGLCRRHPPPPPYLPRHVAQPPNVVLSAAIDSCRRRHAQPALPPSPPPPRAASAAAAAIRTCPLALLMKCPAALYILLRFSPPPRHSGLP